ncbi:hypothetical protein HIM_04937 [Hirsutella minnesotensis 3608]|uniref:Uncharacterized protein n=1 Tax=Hirsutella minnesotensis 3608 TaxID=1043627 RepID=A0A0F7ZPM9_9HYPO|nr:hypothetical protein HIM_04937 [Hirsutella minnesotensis 3608]
MTLVDAAQPDAAILRRSISPRADITLRSPLGSNPFVQHRQTPIASPIASPKDSRSPTTTLARPNYSSGPLEPGGGVGSDTDDVDNGELTAEQVAARHTSNDITALVDFFTNFPPPPDNYMSMASDANNPERGRSAWCKLRRIGRRARSAPRSPKQMRLPDSAVSGTTTGGHRHIAISIPLEAMPFADVPKSQHPMYPGQGPSRRTKGAPAPLRLDTRGSEAPSSNFSPSRSTYSRGHTLPPSQWIRSPETPASQSPGARPFDYVGILPGRVQNASPSDPVAPWTDDHRVIGAGQSGQSTPARQRTPLPARSSSFAARRGRGQPPSIDGLISQPRRKPPPDCSKALPREPSPPRSRLSDNRSRLSDNVSKASVSSMDSSEWGKPKKSSAALGNGSERPGAAVRRQDGRSSALTVIADSPIVSHRDPSPPPPPPPPKAACRKDIVRDKKRRDLQAIRNAKLKRAQSEGDASAMITPETALLLGDEETDEPLASETRFQRLTMSNMMVVADLQPSGSPRMKPCRSSAPPATVESHPNSPNEAPRPRDPNMATPPVSANGSPPTRHATMDRTSLTRRREWKAIREQERKAREALAHIRLEAYNLAAGRESYDDGNASPIEKEIMCLYEAYREHRLKDMERRLRRLERNGDVWLRALVPVLDNVNRTLLAAANGDIGNKRLSNTYASDDEDAARAHSDRRRASRQNIAQTKLLQKLARQRTSDYNKGDVEEDDDDDEGDSNLISNDTWTDSLGRSDDFNGLGSIEPLMRELASEGRRRQRASLIPRSFGSVSRGQEQQTNYGLTA